MLSAPLSDEYIIFNSVMEEISLYQFTLSPIYQGQRGHYLPQFWHLNDTMLTIHGIWGFERFSMLAKCVPRCPPREKSKKRVVISSLLWSRLQRWQQGDLVALWQETKMESNGTIQGSRKLSLQRATTREQRSLPEMVVIATLHGH